MSIFAPLGNTNVTRGHGVQNDVFSSNVTVNCDPRLVVPMLGLAGRKNALYKDEIAGKIAVEHDLCDLDVRNLTINGTLIVPGDTVLSCTVIKADGAVCCPLTVENTNAQTTAQGGQVGNALCVKGTTVMIPLTDPATTDSGQALLFLDGTQQNVVLTNDYMRIDARPLSSGIGIDISLDSGGTTTAMTGKGIQVFKGGSSLQNATTADGGRLLYVTAPDEHGLASQTPPFADSITLAEINGPRLEDLNAGGDGAVGATGAVPGSIRIATDQSALWVNCVPQSGGVADAQRTAPAGALFVDGGTVFRGQAPDAPGVGASRGSHGHIHSSQVTPPRVQVAFNEGAGQIDAKPIDSSTDTCGRIEISETVTAGGTVIAQIIVTYTVPYPLNAPPIVLLTPDQNLAKANDASVGFPISLSFTGTPIFPPVGGVVDESVQFVFNISFATTSGSGNTIGFINYHVIGLI